MKLPLGFRYATTYAGIRKAKKDDLALIVPDQPARAAAVFTRNMVQAAPVKLAKQNLKISKGKVAAVLINAGNANCATRTGERVALASCKALAKVLKTRRAEYIRSPTSTGVIGVELEANLLTAPLPKLVEHLDAANFQAVAEAIMTTDTRPKIASEEVACSGGIVHVAGMTKGSGMIHPNMATTLGFVMTDAAADAEYLAEMLRPAIDRSFNSLTVDGEMSTNDMVILLASGASKVPARPAKRAKAVCGMP